MSEPTPTDERTDRDCVRAVFQTDGGATPAAESECYDSDDGFHTCPDCGGECEYQSPEVVVCLACATEFSHFYDHDGTNNLFRAPDMEHVCAVYDPADDQRGNETVITDGGQDPFERLFVEDADDRPDEIVVEELTTIDAEEFVNQLESLADAADVVTALAEDLERLRRTGFSDDDARDLIYGRNSGMPKRDIEAIFDGIDQLTTGRADRPTERLLAEIADLTLSETGQLMDELDRLNQQYGDRQ